MTDNETFDALIIGGGTVGAAAALALARTGREVALIDRKPPEEHPEDAPLDPRVVAVSPGSKRLLEALGAWRHVRPARIAAYADMQVVAGRGKVHFRATEHGLAALGRISELPELDQALWREMKKRRRISIHAPADVQNIDVEDDEITVTLADGQTLAGRMLLGADGAKSRVRAAAGIEATMHHYNQRAIVAHLATEQSNPGTAWQRFTDLGPLALLPLPEGRSSLVWSVHDDEADRLMEMGEEAFLEILTEHCVEPPFGAFTATGERHALPLIRRQSKPLAAGRIALLGDAARSVHPLAGQGLNLGLADVAALVEALDGWQSKQDPSDRLARYSRRRWSDSVLVAGGIHAINETRTLGELGKHALGAGFTAMRFARPAREIFVRRACGLDEVRKAVGILAG
ncbi:MAG: FAD-dependent monooxygenase [Wenzhouxiangellaceae bacterium]|nr:FAD-dependent monooxygenase [Wenzhouxiangellaceae bacterium]MBS3747386.1 FAD-dependent monooxygenase [Wenzhouxiangellaceae bacterium]MBS3823877.1 FAD-dependent monooxygenase [Wenzhouxiangellaceae bacterium]